MSSSSIPTASANTCDTKTKRFNLKLPQSVRGIFEEPYDAYLQYLLSLADHYNTSIEDRFEESLAKLPKNFQGSTSRWTLWVSKDIRQLFDERKAVLAPNKTHGGFVEVLLAHRLALAESGQLIPFEKERFASDAMKKPSTKQAKKPFGSDVTMSISQNMFALNPNYTLLNLFPSNQIGTDLVFGQDSSQDSFGERSAFSLNSFDSQGSVLPKKLSRNVDLTIQTGDDLRAKRLRYTYEKAAPYPTPSPYLNHATTLNNLNDELNGLNMFYAPTEECFPSPDIYEATKLNNLPVQQNMGFEFNFNHDLQKEQTLPDLGPLYQPISLQLGDALLDFGHIIPNI